MKYDFIDWQEFEAPGATEGEAVGVLTLNRPDLNNAFGPRMAMELDTILDEIRHRQVRVVVVTGAGETFCSSADLTEAIEPLEQPEIDSGMRDEDGEFARWAIKDQFHAITQRAFRKLEGLPQAVIAAIDGAAIGAGFEMTLACDLRIMTDRARLSEISVPAGVVSEWSCSRNLPKLVGQTIANELILTGRSSALRKPGISAWSTGSWRPKV